MSSYDATQDFAACLEEVEFLLGTAAKCEGKPKEYSALVKASLVLLAAKFESFVEEVVEEHATKISCMRPLTLHLPKAIKVHSTLALLPDNFKESLRSGNQDAIDNLKKAASLWNDAATVENLVVDKAFNYGRHGAAEIEKIFLRVGLEYVFDSCVVEESVPSFAGEEGADSTPIRIDVKANVNALTHLRNNILHNDSSPSLTHQQVETYKCRLVAFGEQVDKALVRLCTSLSQAGDLKSS